MNEKELKEHLYSKAKESKFGSFAKFAQSLGFDRGNFSIRIRSHFSNLNSWLNHLDLEIKIIEKTTKTVLFQDIEITECFDIVTDLGKVEMLKTHLNSAICLSSENASYEKGKDEPILQDQECIIYLNHK